MEDELNHGYLQQDGATAHIECNMNVLREGFSGWSYLKTPLATTKSQFDAPRFLFMGKAERYGLRKQSKNYR
jgi:hypothetical protein